MSGAKAIQRRLLELRDAEYGDFTARLVPNLPRETLIGVRMPALRALAGEVRGTPEAEAFLRALPHRYYDENNLHAALIGFVADYDACIGAVDAFLPYVDNWATCDMMSPRALGRNKAALRAKIGEWMASGETYSVRFGMGMLMRWFLDADFDPADLEAVAALETEEYYVRMMAAWYFATALAKQYDAALPFIREKRLPPWTHNKAIQKAIESRRIDAEKKEVLRKLKIPAQRKA